MLKFNRSNSVQWNVARSLLAAAVWVFAVLVSAPTAFAVTRHVSLTGEDSGPTGPNTCSDQSKPCRTINWAVGQAQSGEIISVDEGHYVEQPITVSKSLKIQGGMSRSMLK